MWQYISKTDLTDLSCNSTRRDLGYFRPCPYVLWKRPRIAYCSRQDVIKYLQLMMRPALFHLLIDSTPRCVDSFKTRLVGCWFWPKLNEPWVSPKKKKKKRILDDTNMAVFIYYNFSSGLSGSVSAGDTSQYGPWCWSLTLAVWTADED